MNIRTTIRSILALLTVLAFLTAACGAQASSTGVQMESTATARNQSQLNIAQPVPAFEWSQDRDTLIQIYKAKNEARNTWTVFMSDLGNPIDSCPSMGYPIPGGTQLTNPMTATIPYTTAVVTLPQAEPNGLYTDPNTNSTYVLCVLADGTITPVYSEPKVVTYAYPTEVKDGKITHPSGGKSTIVIDKSQAPGASKPTPRP